jgi:RHS repeat-associated protein
VIWPGSTAGIWSTRFVHSDGLGSVRVLDDETGTTIDTRGYEAFGTKNTEAGSDPLVYGFAGEAFDSTSHLAYHRARWMDSRIGRFEGMDPWEGDVHAPATLHRYVYASNEPNDRVDPSGRDDIGGVDDDFGAALSFGNIVASVSRTSATGQYANLRARAIHSDSFLGDLLFSHLYIEYGDPDKLMHRVFEAEPDFTPHVQSKYGYLHGLERPWGSSYVRGDDPTAPSLPNYTANESNDDSGAPLIGVTTATYSCLEKSVALYNSQSILYDEAGGGFFAKIPEGRNSNWWATAVCHNCGLTYESVPGFWTPGAE